MAKPLSTTTVQVWRFLAAYIDEHGYAPTLREVSAGCFVSQATTLRHLLILEVRGFIERTEATARAIRMVERPPQL